MIFTSDLNKTALAVVLTVPSLYCCDDNNSNHTAPMNGPDWVKLTDEETQSV